MTQKARIIRYLSENGSITPMVAFAELGITKLSTRIGELERENGYEFIKERIKRKNRYGEDCTFMQYRLKQQDGTIAVKEEF